MTPLGERFLSRDEVCSVYKVNRRWLVKQGSRVGGYRRLSHKVVIYERTELENWIRQRQFV
jgi:hypothetical protein